MDGTINEVFIKLSGRVPFNREIRRGEDLTVTAEGQNYIFNCVKREELDKQVATAQAEEASASLSSYIGA